MTIPKTIIAIKFLLIMIIAPAQVWANEITNCPIGKSQLTRLQIRANTNLEFAKEYVGIRKEISDSAEGTAATSMKLAGPALIVGIYMGAHLVPVGAFLAWTGVGAGALVTAKSSQDDAAYDYYDIARNSVIKLKLGERPSSAKHPSMPDNRSWYSVKNLEEFIQVYQNELSTESLTQLFAALDTAVANEQKRDSRIADNLPNSFGDRIWNGIFLGSNAATTHAVLYWSAKAQEEARSVQVNLANIIAAKSSGLCATRTAK